MTAFSNCRFVISVLLLLACFNSAHGFLSCYSGNKNRFSFQRPTSKRWFAPKGRSMTMYVPPTSPTTQTPPMVGQKILASQAPKRKTPQDTRRTTSTAPLSNSVLASCDTLPKFPTAHGLLSPETIQRLDEMIPNAARSEAVAMFLDTYRLHGPMSCLPMLADPDVLPHLTEAMRDIA